MKRGEGREAVCVFHSCWYSFSCLRYSKLGGGGRERAGEERWGSCATVFIDVGDKTYERGGVSSLYSSACLNIEAVVMSLQPN